MNKLFAIAALAAATPAFAAEAPVVHRFSKDGQTYVYTATTEKSRQVIDGYSVNTGSRFHLIVRNDMVAGDANGQPVMFPVPASARSTPVETALR